MDESAAMTVDGHTEVQPSIPEELAKAGKPGPCRLSMDDDLHIVFRWQGDDAFLVTLGSHDELY